MEMTPLSPAPHLSDTSPLSPLFTPLAMPESNALAYILCPTPAEFLAQYEEPGAAILQQRIGEARIPADVQFELVHYPDTVNFLAVIGAALPDAALLLPLWMRIAQSMPRADLRVVDESALPLLNRLLGEDANVDLENADLPMLLVLDEEWRYQESWGPRPIAAELLLDEWLAQHPEYEAPAEADEPGNGSDQSAWLTLAEALCLQMRVWYNSGLDTDAAREILALLVSLQDVAPDTGV